MASNTRHDTLAQSLGWFSLGLGLAEILAPNKLAETIGVERRPVLFRLLGAREIASGLGILLNRQPSGWLWSRVAGDGMDLALLCLAGSSQKRTRQARRRRIAAMAMVTGCAALDAYCSQASTQRRAKA